MGRSGGQGGPCAGEGREAEWAACWRRPRRVASVDEVGRGNDDDAEGGWGLEQEAWMGGDLWQPGFHAAQHGHKWDSVTGGGGADDAVNITTGGLG